jgi:uncharacterized membrane protein required for colicin V production
MNLVDIFILILILCSGYAGLKTGLIRTIGSLAALLLGIWIGWQFRLPLVYYAENKFGWVTALTGWLQENVPFFRLLTPAAASASSQFELWFEQIQNTFLPWLHTAYNPAEQMAVILLSVLAFILIFALVRFIVGGGFHLLQQLIDHTPLHLINHGLGLVAGGLKGLFYGMLLIFLLTPFLSTGAFLGWEWSGTVMQMLTQSFFYRLGTSLIETIQSLWLA